MKNAMRTVALTSLFTLMVTMSQADEFIRPPEIYAPVWYTSFPYQRNIDIGFGVYPVSSPGNGIPGAVYEGTLDPVLLYSDYVYLTGSVTWYASVSGFTQTGLIGIDNRAGNSTLTGTAVFHIDDVDDNLPLKDFWAESLDIDSQTYPGEYLNWSLYDPNGNPETYLGGPANTLYNGEWLSDAEWQSTPNPPYETFVETFTVPAGQYALIDQLHIATECVPEPTSFGLLALGGLLGLCRLLRWKQS